MKKIFTKYFDDVGLFFRQDEKGHDLFYPWGYYGDAIYIDKPYKLFIHTYIFGIFFSSILYIFIKPYIFEPFDFAGQNWADTWVSLFIPLSYFLLCWALIRKRGIYAVKLEKAKPRKFRIVYVMWFVIIIQAGTIYNVLSYQNMSFQYVCFLILSIPYTLFLVHFSIMLPKRHGFYFTKKE